jgi:periplasmic protein TonB
MAPAQEELKMFTNLIESESHLQEFKRRSSFFLATVAGYALILFTAGIASIYAYDARLEAQSNDLIVENWIPPVNRDREPIKPQPVRHTPASANTPRTSSQPVRPVLYESANNPTKPPDQISAAPNPIPPAPPNAIIGNKISDPIDVGAPRNCTNCAGNSAPVIRLEDDKSPPPAPAVVKPPTQRLPSQVLSSKALNLPQPVYPMIARQIRAQGPVNVQILVDEQGRVVSAQPISGHPTLIPAAREAAMRARFSPTVLNGVPVKVQGVITYNFVLQ